MSAVILALRKRAASAQAQAEAALRASVIAQAKEEIPVMFRGWRGEWDKDTDYEAGDTVGFDGSSYIAVENSKGAKPSKSDKWNVIAKKGKDGKHGKDGKDIERIFVAGGNSGGAQPGAVDAPLFIIDVTSAAGIVGDKTYAPGTTPANAVLQSCVTDSAQVRVHVATGAPSDAYSPQVLVNGVPATLAETSTARWFTGYADISLAEGGNDIVATNGSGSGTAEITLAADGPAVLSVEFGDFPNDQSTMKGGDPISVTVLTATDATQVTFSGAVTGTLVASGGVATGSVTAGAGQGAVTSSVVARNALGTPGAPFTSGALLLDQIRPTFSAAAVEYPNGQNGLQAGESARVTFTVSGETSLAYGGAGLTVELDPDDQDVRVVSHALEGYHAATLAVTAYKSSNGSSAVKNIPIVIATDAPTFSIGILGNPARLISLAVYEVRLTPSYPLLGAPSLDSPAGEWVGAWQQGAGYWYSTLRITDASTRGAHEFTNAAGTGASGAIGGAITAGAGFTVGGFATRTLTFPAFSRVAAIGTTVGDATKLAAQVNGGNVLARYTDSGVHSNGFYPANADGSYNAQGGYIGLSDTSFAAANTSGTLQVIVSEGV